MLSVQTMAIGAAWHTANILWAVQQHAASSLLGIPCAMLRAQVVLSSSYLWSVRHLNALCVFIAVRMLDARFCLLRQSIPNGIIRVVQESRCKESSAKLNTGTYDDVI